MTPLLLAVALSGTLVGIELLAWAITALVGLFRAVAQ